MPVAFDPSDVPVVSGRDMLIALQAVVQAGRAGVFFQGASNDDLAAIQEEFWSAYEGSSERGGIVLIRLWSLIDVLQARRLKDRVMLSGLNAIEAAVSSAGELRLNMSWGFAPQKLIWAIERTQARAAERRVAPVRLKREAIVQLATAA